MTFYDTFNNKKHRKKMISINLYKHQVKIIDGLKENDVYHSRSECIRIALEFFLSNEYSKALRKNENKIINAIKKHNGKKRK